MKKSNALKNWKKFSRLNWYYYLYVEKVVKNLVPADASVLEFSSKLGELLKSLSNKHKIGVEFNEEFTAKKSGKVRVLGYNNLSRYLKNDKYDYILLSNTLSELDDIQEFLKNIKKFSHQDTRVVVLYFNYLWKPLLDIGEMIGLKRPETKLLNWLSGNDIDNFFALEGYEPVKTGRGFVVPFEIPVLSDFVNKYISPLPIFQNLSLLNFSVYKPISQRNEVSISVIIPARNESGNMKGVINKIPYFNKGTEVIFVEGNSTDNTYEVISNEVKKYKGKIKPSLYKQKGIGKGDAVRLGFSKAKNELLMILDADLTVDPSELKKFYKAFVEGRGDLIMGSRLIYPMEKEAMRTLNILGNKFFSSAFSFLLDQKIKDTLCGTKVLLKRDYQRIANNRKVFGDFDPFGDFDLIFGAAKLNMKILEIPIRYKERVYGTTNISRFSHGLLLLKMLGFAMKKFKFI